MDSVKAVTVKNISGNVLYIIYNGWLTLYLPHFESQYLVHLQILIKIAQETSSFHTYGVNDWIVPGEHCVKRRIRRD